MTISGATHHKMSTTMQFLSYGSWNRHGPADWGDLLPSSLYPPQKGIDLASNGPRHSPIGEPLSLALENVAILWWATPPENWRARQWLTSNRSPQSAGPWQFHEQTLRNCIVVDILWWVAPENATIRNLVHFRWCSSTHFLHSKSQVQRLLNFSSFYCS